MKEAEMGTNIHATIEVKTERGWVCIDTMQRWAHDFRTGYKGRIRFDELNDAAIPGRPEDATDTTLYFTGGWYRDDFLGRNIGYLPIDRAAEIFRDTDPDAKRHSMSISEARHYYFGLWGNLDQEHRIIFWFVF